MAYETGAGGVEGGLGVGLSHDAADRLQRGVLWGVDEDGMSYELLRMNDMGREKCIHFGFRGGIIFPTDFLQR